MKYIEVVAAIIIDKDKNIFCARRKDQGELALKWEFPGGKIEPNESRQEALKREIEEEFSTSIEVGEYVMTVRHQYIHFHLTMHAYYAKINSGGMQLNEHTDSKWLRTSDLKNLDWAAADIPIVERLYEIMKE